jgi:hypothetical protein
MRGRTNPPSVPLCVSRVRPVFVFVATTFADTITAPLGSITVPARVPDGSAAQTTFKSRKKARKDRIIKLL